MALRGNLKDFSLPDVFQLVTLSGKTGILRIKRADDAEGSVWFRDGDVFFAQSNWQHEPLGERMVSAGKITPSALARVLELQRAEPDAGRRLGQLLVDEGYITDKVLEAFVQEQIQDTIFDLFRWDEGAFDFEPLGDVPGDEDIGLTVSIENIVMEGSRRLEEWNRIKKKIPSMEIVFKMATAPGEGTFEISLKPIEWNLLLLVDGTRSVADLATDTNRTDFEVSRILYGLFSAGLLEVASDEEVERLRAERAKLEERRGAAKPAPKAAPAAPRAAAASEAAAPAEATPAEVHAEPEVPEFLSGAAAAATPEDMAVFQEMMGAVLQPPEAGVEAPTEPSAPVEPPLAAELAPEAVAEAPTVEPEAQEPLAEPVAEALVVEPAMEEPAPEPVAEALVAEPAMAEPAPEPVLEAPLEPVMETAAEAPAEPVTEYFTPDIAVAEPMSAVEAPGTTEMPGIVHEPAAALTEDLLAPIAEVEEAPPEASVTAEPALAEQPELTIAEIEALAAAPDLQVVPPGEELEEPTGAPPEAEAVEDLSALLASLKEESPLEQAVPDTEPIVEVSGPVVEEATEVISTDAFLSDFDEPAGGSLSGGLGDELTALTGGGGRARQAAPTIRTNMSYDTSSVPHRDQMVDKDLVMKVIDGIKNL